MARKFLVSKGGENDNSLLNQEKKLQKYLKKPSEVKFPNCSRMQD